MKKKVLALMMTAVMAAGMLSGCGSKDASSAGNGATDAAGSAEAGSAEAGTTPLADEKIDVLNQSEKMRLAVVCLQGFWWKWHLIRKNTP